MFYMKISYKKANLSAPQTVYNLQTANRDRVFL